MLSRGVNQRSQATCMAARYRSCSLRYSVYDTKYQHALGQAAVQVEQHGMFKPGTYCHAAALLGDAARVADR